MIFTTSICANYLPKAIVLAQSVKSHHPGSGFILCLTERERLKEADCHPSFDAVVLSKDLGIGNFNNFIFRHTVKEAATAVKALLFKYLLDKYPFENEFIYLDPDIYVLSEFSELKKILEVNDIVLTPQLTIPEHKERPESTFEAVVDNELCSLQHGVFNLGFLGIKRSAEGIRFVEWWNERLQMFCYDDIPRGIFTDQKWIDLAPCFFDHIKILKHPGYNVAPWNISMRKISQTEGHYFANGEPIRFFHFSGFDSGANLDMIRKYVPDEANALYGLREKYVSLLKEEGQEKFGGLKWSYDYYDSGEKIADYIRKVYRWKKNLVLQDPFSLSNRTLRKLLYRRNFKKRLADAAKVFLRRSISFVRRNLNDAFYTG